MAADEECKPGVVPEGYEVLKEGQASILLRTGKNEVFYNNAQVTNRDLSICVLRRFLPLRAQELAESGRKGRKQLKQQQRAERHKERQQQEQQEWKKKQQQQPEGQQLAVVQQQQQVAADQEPSQPGAQPDPLKEQPADVQPADEGAGAPESTGPDKNADVADPDEASAQDAEREEVAAAAGVAAAPDEEVGTCTTEREGGEAGAGQASAAAANANGAKAPKVPGAKVLEGLAASGLRSIRYALEVPGIAHIDANDLDRAAVHSIQRNAQFNGPEASSRIRTIQSDARLTMLQNPLAYDVIDLDPYGTPVSFLDSAMQSVRDGGLLLITATDMANLCGSNGISAHNNYGSYPIHRPYCHEMALRILLSCIESHAVRYRRHIVPLLSVSIDFYIRVFVRVYTNPAAAKDSPCKLAYVWQSAGCDSFYLQSVGQKKVYGSSIKYQPGHGPAVPQECRETGSGFYMGGPIWSEPIHDREFVEGIMQDLEQDSSRLAASARVLGILRSVLEELPDVPLYYNLHDMCKTIKCQPPKGDMFRSALVNAGYRVSGSHANPNALKTDAPGEVLWDILRCWVRKHPISTKEKKGANPYAATLLSKAPQLEADFSRAAGAISKAKAQGQARFVQNPAYWGPMARHNRPPVEKPSQTPGHNRKETQPKRCRDDEGGADAAAGQVEEVAGGQVDGGASSNKRAHTEGACEGGV